MKRKIIIVDVLIVLTVIAVSVVFYFTQPKAPTTNSESSLINIDQKNMDIPQHAGIKIEKIMEGEGNGVVSGQTAIVDYTGMLTDGTVFDSSIPRGEPFPVRLGAGEVIQGWELGILGMKVGEKRKLTISPELGYGAQGFPGVIPPNAILIFEVTLKSIQ